MTTDDRRATIEAAFEAAEKAVDATPTIPETPLEAEVSTQADKVATETPAETTPAAAAETTATEAVSTETAPAEIQPGLADETAPHGWKAPAKSKWGTVDPEIRQEVLRRERQVTQVLNESASARQVAKQLNEALAPFAQRFQAMGVEPVAVFKNLLQADYHLSNGSKHQRAELVAKLIKDYDVDIDALDKVLAGRVSPEATEEARLARLLDQRLAPVQQRLQTFEERERQAQAAAQQVFADQLSTMEADTKTYPYFQQVRNAMADLVEINANRGIPLDLKTAYNRAVAADTQLSAQADSAKQAEVIRQAALRAQRAKAASASVSGSPSGTTARGVSATDRRATIAAAFEALGG